MGNYFKPSKISPDQICFRADLQLYGGIEVVKVDSNLPTAEQWLLLSADEKQRIVEDHKHDPLNRTLGCYVQPVTFLRIQAYAESYDCPIDVAVNVLLGAMLLRQGF